MEHMDLTVLSVRFEGRNAHAYVRAAAGHEAVIHLFLQFEAQDGDLWEQARDQALRYLDIA